MKTKTKTCTGSCGKTKSVTQFKKRSSTADGLNPWCSDCDRQYRQKMRAAKSSKSPAVKTTKTNPVDKKTAKTKSKKKTLKTKSTAKSK